MLNKLYVIASLKVNNNGRLEIETQNGDVSVKVGGMSKLSAETGNGDVSIKANGTGKINAETQNGDITVKATEHLYDEKYPENPESDVKETTDGK